MAGEIICRCDSCTARFKIDAKFAGRKAKCPKCTAVVLVPGTAVAGSTTSTSTVVPPSTPATAAPPPSRTAPPKATAAPVAAAAPAAIPPTASASAPPPRRPAVAATPPALPQPTEPPVSLGEPSPAAIFTVSDGPKNHADGVALATGSSSGSAPYTRKKTANNLPVILAAVGALVLLALGGTIFGGLYVAGVFDSAPTKNGLASRPKTGQVKTGVLINWTPAERKGGSVTIDGKPVPLPAIGDVEYPLAAGQHEILLRRRGYEPIDATVTVTDGQRASVATEWKPDEIALAANGLAANGLASEGTTPNSIGTNSPGTGSSTSNSSRPSTSFPIGGAAPTGPPGFDGYLQDLDAAAKQATAEGKFVLALFGSTDSDELTLELGEAFNTPEFKDWARSYFVMVLIDFPRTTNGLNYVEDTARNMVLRDDYSIRQIPMVTLFDGKLQAYHTTTDFEQALEDPVAAATEWQKHKAKRDELFSAIKTVNSAAEFAPIIPALDWIREASLIPYYQPQVESWYNAAASYDADNQNGCLEVIFEPYLVTKLIGTRRSDARDKKAVLDLTKPWLNRQFIDPNRAVQTHLMAAQLYSALENETEAENHLKRANSYKPTKTELVEALRQVNLMLTNRNVLSTGTGFLISEAGYVMTNNHVIEGEGKVVVRIPGQPDPVPAEVIARDEVRDMALLKLTIPEGANLTPVAIVDSSVGRGASVAAFGFPLGDALGTGLKFTTGFVSTPPEGTDNNMILLDMRVNPGNSGGPLVDSSGNVVGMITAKTGGFGVDSYGFALPTSDLMKFVDTNLPADAARPAPEPEATTTAWDKVDKRVSPGVLMILKIDE